MRAQNNVKPAFSVEHGVFSDYIVTLIVHFF
jgi:hypothetical protein